MRPTPIPLEAGYTAEFDRIGRKEWNSILEQFADANIYQTWDYDAVRCGEKNISHFILRSGDQIVAVAQARKICIPFLGLGVAYIRWGPVWKRRDQPVDPYTFRMAIRALRNEYVSHRGLILRISPTLFCEDDSIYLTILSEEGYRAKVEKNRSSTLIVKLSPPLEGIRKNFDQKWRNCLNKAEKNGLQIIKGTDDHLFEEFIVLYRELLERKQFKEPNDINEFRRIQCALPHELKMVVFLCRSEGANSSGGIFSVFGETGLYLFGATSNRGMADKGSYLIQWEAIRLMKQRGCLSYNLNGINSIANPGSYHFKAGIAGKNCRDLHYLGAFDCFSSPLKSTLSFLGDLAFPFLRKTVISLAPKKDRISR